MCSSGGSRPSTDGASGGAVAQCPTPPPPDFSVEIDLPETGDKDLLKPLDNTHYAQPTGEWRTWRDSIVTFDIEIDSDDSSFCADQTEISVHRGSEVLFSDVLTEEIVAKGDHEWYWDGFDTNNILDTSVLMGPGVSVTVEVTKSGVTRSATEALDNEPEKVDWLELTVDLDARTIEISVYFSFENESGMADSDFILLKDLVYDGINRYWSRDITIDGDTYQVTTNGYERSEKCIDVDLNIRTDREGGRSHASGIIDTTLFYNLGFFHNDTSRADEEFKFTAAHEFGHTVLEESRGRGYSWGHKGTSNPILQTVLSSSPIYPATGEMDLMYYYNGDRPVPWSTNFYPRNSAIEEDVKLLIWLCQVDFDED